MAVQSGANVVCSEASTGGSVEVWGRSPGSVVDVVGGTVVVVVVVVVVMVGPNPTGEGLDPQLARATPTSAAAATTAPGDRRRRRVRR